MSSNVIVQVPDTLREYHTHLREFFECMIHKLHKNSHKHTPTMETLLDIMDKLVNEINEFESQVAKDKFDPNSLMELADQANFAFLAYVVLRNEGVKYDTNVARRVGQPPEPNQTLGDRSDHPNTERS